MALVRITKAVVSDINQNLASIRTKENTSIEQNISEQHKAIAAMIPRETILAAVWGDHYHLLPLMPEEWCVLRTNSLSLYFDIPTQPSYPSYEIITCETARDNPFILPPKASGYSTISVRLPHTLVPQPMWDDLLALRQQKLAAIDRHDAIGQQVKSILDAYPSLNKAVFAFPDLRTLLTPTLIAMLDAPAKLKKRPTGTDADAYAEDDYSVPVLDTTLLNHTLAMNTLLTGGK